MSGFAAEARPHFVSRRSPLLKSLTRIQAPVALTGRYNTNAAVRLTATLFFLPM